MAEVKPMGAGKDQRVGFPQKYNQEQPPAADLNPDAVTDATVLPKPLATPKAPKAPKARTSKRSKK